MSYDLSMFEPAATPRTEDEFFEWWEDQAKWGEEHSYDDPVVSSPALQNWFAEAREFFPPMNGPLALSDEEFDELSAEEEARVTDYSIGRDVIYAAFAWSVAEDARKTALALAVKHKVGFFNTK